MDTARCQELAERLHLLLLQQLGMGLDTPRMLAEPLYARDVLLVCAAHPGTELAALAWEYRDAAAPARPAGASSSAPERAPTPQAGQQGSPQGAPQGAHQNGRRTDPSTHPGTHPSTDNQRTALRGRPAAPNGHEPDSSPPERSKRSALSRFPRLSLSRFSASIFGGSLFEGTVFGSRQADPETDFGDESYLTPPQGQPPQRAGDRKKSNPNANTTEPAALDKTAGKPARVTTPRRTRWFGR